MDLTLEGVGGGWAPDMASCGAEALGALALTEALRLRAGNLARARGWAECPSEVWTETYGRVLRQTRAPPTSKWGQQEDEGFILEQLYENNWNQSSLAFFVLLLCRARVVPVVESPWGPLSFAFFCI